MEAEHGEGVDRIVEQMEPDDAEHLTFVAEFAGRSFNDETDRYPCGLDSHHTGCHDDRRWSSFIVGVFKEGGQARAYVS